MRCWNRRDWATSERMKFLHPEHDAQLELSLDDVFLVPGYFDGVSRRDVDLTPPDFAGSRHPVVSANMNGVTGKRMAETMARYGGLGVLPQDMDAFTVDRIVRHIKGADTRYDTAITVGPEAPLRDIAGLIRKRAHDMVVVIDEGRRPVGIITHADLRQRDQYTPAHQVMARRLVTFGAAGAYRDAFELMDQQRLSAVPVVDNDGVLRGILTREDAVRLEILAPALNRKGELMVAAAVGISAHADRQAASLVETGVDVIVLDTAHGHQRRMVEAIRSVRAAIGAQVPIVAGNVCTAEGTRALCEAGADVIKVNVGPGAMCTTRMKTGVGRPTFSAVATCANAAHRHGKHIWADGGVKHPRDVALYLAAGAARVMVGTWLAGTYESPGDMREDREGFLYKENYGMASARAVRERAAGLDAFEQAQRAFFREGISSARVYVQRGSESVGSILVDILSGLRSAFTYLGAANWDEFHSAAVVGVQTSGGYKEGRPVGSFRGGTR